MIRELHDGMKAKVNFNGRLAEPIDIDNGVKQSDIDAPTFVVRFCFAFKDCDKGIYIKVQNIWKTF